ncbi:MAG: DUF3574 domain-containing protein [Treponema sp.]|nr:DUF3574 domain-containing protein [Candidatus Treponema equifaecale]
MKNLKKIAVVSFALILIGFNLFYVLNSIQKSNEPDCQYTLYIGTNDKDTYKPEISYDDAVKLVAEICSEHLEGYTIFDADGYWTDESGTPVSERTIVCKIINSDSEAVQKIIDKVLVKLNQSSVLVEKSMVNISFVSRDKSL